MGTMFKQDSVLDTVAEQTGFSDLSSSMWFYPVILTGTVLLGCVVWFRKKLFGCGEASGAEDVGLTSRWTRESFVGRSLRSAKKSSGLDGRLILGAFIVLAIAAALAAAWFFYRAPVTPSAEEAQEPDIENQIGGP